MAVTGITNATAIGSRYYHTCVVLLGGTVKCWGLNEYGQLGDGTATTRSLPVTALFISDAIAVTTGRYHTCVLVASGSVKCWGFNSHGELGDGTTSTRTTPAVVVSLSNVV